MSLFVTFEGPEGSGKSTQARLLYESLHARRFPVILTREPGGTRIGDLIRRIVLDLQHTEMAPTTEMLLFSAARAQLVSEVIRPYLDQGGIVLCDRYADSTFAYQGYGLGRDLAELRVITAAATGGLRPDITFYLDISAVEGLERKCRKGARSTGQHGVGVEWNRLDARELEYHRRVEAGYRELIAADPERWRVLDARQSIEALAEQIAAIVEPYLASITRLETVP
ncbi:MAG: dTMP kinase [Roseiflexus sp.]|jgi:dTMP kinase|nr:dTMP kinase [Roseiflexus sp.]MBO9334551.1 dTMP kinase [Roseiflexus sp.]MBO9340719.1 dTMP kinase [Roseiflexus sp.]MBO9364877.1 dTMP kinase [Roseiflexus sp.]MBO9383047.1 dTMP kinase [Roseiflexus sp.]